MKKIFVLSILFAVGLFTCLNSVNAEEMAPVEQPMSETMIETLSVKTHAAAEKTADSLKVGSKKAANAVKSTSVKAAKSTAKHVKSGAKKAKAATVRGANKVSNSTAKGMKKAAVKMQNKAEQTIERTDEELAKTAPKCKCNCGENCNCNSAMQKCEQ